jgi:hypothetical protein
MKYIKASWAFVNVLFMIANQPGFKKAMDQILDIVEDTFEGKDVQDGCLVVRNIFDVPDYENNDTEE